eukprot:CAMPEP_0201554486 /NCGR_PEP_ID=MMETSP0173_2-20130828/41532_1 /ASSEMBLY_ACC=CAM_ASM_000268 /TAXON_ID=218659 /ORGANISM="Vexillifera sp., Strain DIVA3 564/2" /LENGTH=78 /DNA_ID=CAMNT_0047965781 /DNA_START=1 /DNA_END=234 /DNA_ORIENTATION=+
MALLREREKALEAQEAALATKEKQAENSSALQGSKGRSFGYGKQTPAERRKMIRERVRMRRSQTMNDMSGSQPLSKRE